MCWHKYTKWVTVEEGRVYTKSAIFSDQPRVTGNYLVQKKTCEKCGKVKMRTVQTDLN